MSFLKSILNIFKKKEKKNPFGEIKIDVEKADKILKNITEVVEEKSGPGIIEMIAADKDETMGSVLMPNIEVPVEPLPTLPTKKSLKELSARKPKRQTKLHPMPVVSMATSIWERPESDNTPNPAKYWRRFKRGDKYFWKKFYHEQIVLP